MKKRIIIIISVVLLLLGVGGGAYYYFFMMNKDEVITQEPVEPQENTIDEQEDPAVMAEPNFDYYIVPSKLNVRAYPRNNAVVRSVLRKGNFVKGLEIDGDWVRISDYEVHESGHDVADWVNIHYLSHNKPEITPQEIQNTMIALIKDSDDFDLYQDKFVEATKLLIEDKTCSYEDFELMNSWILSRTFNSEPVYFVYCSGTAQENKVYLNVNTGEIFQP